MLQSKAAESLQTIEKSPFISVYLWFPSLLHIQKQSPSSLPNTEVYQASAIMSLVMTVVIHLPP